jgi:hypothetical protein
MAPIFSPRWIASPQSPIISPARGATMVAPRMRSRPPEHKLDQPLRRALGLRAVLAGERLGQDRDLVPDRARLNLDQARMGEFGIGAGHPGQRGVVQLRGQAEQRVPDHDAGVAVGDMRALRFPGDVADRMDVAGRAAQPRISGDAARRRGDARRLEPEP